ncbi:signal peptidase I [Candidatus Babeliales bacterium]|nr:signal peptidase I [Candidatus Babeliales bacterium]
MLEALKAWLFTESKKERLKKEARELVVIIVIAFLIRTVIFGLYQVPTGSMETTMLVGERFFADKFTIMFSPPKNSEIITFNDPTYDYSSNSVVFLWQKYVWGPANWTKRVIGIPGDTVEGKIEDDKPVVYVNGKKLDEPYLNKYPLVPVSAYTWRSYDPKRPYYDQPFYNMDAFDVRRAQRYIKQVGMRTIKHPGTKIDAPGADTFKVVLGPDQYWVMGDNRLGSSDSRTWGILDGNLIHGKIKVCIFSVDSSESWWILDLLKHPIGFWSKVRWRRCLKVVS